MYSILEDISVHQLQLYFQSEILKFSLPEISRNNLPFFFFFLVYTIFIQGLEDHRRTPALFAISSQSAYSGSACFILALQGNKF